MANKVIKPELETILKKYIEILKKNIVVLDAYLFGSYVKGTFKEDSDIDIAIISEQFTGDVIEDTLRLMRFRRDIDLRIEPHPFTPDDFADDNPLVSEIKKYGIKII